MVVSILVITHCCAISVSFYDEVVAPRWYSLDFDLDLLLQSLLPLHVKHRCGLRPFRVCTKQLTMSGWKLTCAFLLAIDVKVTVTLLLPYLNFLVKEVKVFTYIHCQIQFGQEFDVVLYLIWGDIKSPTKTKLHIYQMNFCMSTIAKAGAWLRKTITSKQNMYTICL